MLIGAQAFQSTPTNHAPAIVLAVLPSLAGWAKTLVDGALGAAGVPVTPELIDSMAGNGVLYHGLELLGSGAILSGLVLGATAVFIIERKFETAAIFALAGGVLTFFGFMHGEQVGFNVTPLVALAYAIMAGFLYLCGRLEAPAEKAVLAPVQQPAE
jgi:AGZA family xanthine/uracil permease-like MFS transporter